MNTNTKNLLIRFILIIFLCIVSSIGCSSKHTPPVVVIMPDRIIDKFSDMQEHEIISWLWVRRGFALENCRSIDVKPLTDSSKTPQKAAVKRIQQGLNDIFSERVNENGELDVIVWTNIIDTKAKPGRIKSWFTNFDDFPYVELEIVITDSNTGLALVKIIHFRRNNKSLKITVTDMLGDLRQFFTTAL